jgi:hypothetical protein
MPRGPGPDTERALQHVMVREIEKRRISLTDEDRENLLARMSNVPHSGAFSPGKLTKLLGQVRDLPHGPDGYSL